MKYKPLVPWSEHSEKDSTLQWPIKNKKGHLAKNHQLKISKAVHKVQYPYFSATLLPTTKTNSQNDD